MNRRTKWMSNNRKLVENLRAELKTKDEQIEELKKKLVESEG